MERWTERTELLSELHTIKNRLLGELAEVNMAIMREENAHDAKKLKTVTLQTKEFINNQRPKPLWSTPQYQEQAYKQSDNFEV